MISYYFWDLAMRASARYKAISVTVPSEMEKALDEVCRKEIRKKSEVVTEALRLYFRVRRGKPQLWSLVVPTGEEERAQFDYGAFADEWGSAHDSVYDKLGK
jgi:predicted transcriptional regulator